MNVLVTGGSGFIGSNLCDFLVKKSHEVTVVDNLSTGKISNLVNIINEIDFFEEGIEDFDFNNGSVIFDPFRKTKLTAGLTQKGIQVYNYGNSEISPAVGREDPGRL